MLHSKGKRSPRPGAQSAQPVSMIGLLSEHNSITDHTVTLRLLHGPSGCNMHRVVTPYHSTCVPPCSSLEMTYEGYIHTYIIHALGGRGIIRLCMWGYVLAGNGLQ